MHDLRAVPGLVSIDLHPAASGPEVELVFGTAPDADGPASLELIESEVERLTGQTVLACRRREEDETAITAEEARNLANSFMGGPIDGDLLNSVTPKLEAIIGESLG